MRLFYEDEYAAYRSVIEASGKSYKEVAHALWPAMKPESAYAKLKKCVTEGAGEHFYLFEVIALQRICGRDDVVAYLCDETDHDRPAKRAPADRQAELMREFNQRVGEMKALAAQLERACVSLKAVA